MKKRILLFLSIVVSLSCAAQYPGFSFTRNIVTPSGGSSPSNYKVSCISDSVFYCVRYGGLQSYDLRTGQIKYKFKGIYGITMIVPDGHGKLLLGYNTKIRLYDPSTETAAELATVYDVTDIGASDHKIWVLYNHSTLKTYDGTSWQTITLPPTSSFSTYYYFMLPVGDNSAYFSNGRTIWSYVNSTMDSIYSIPVTHSYSLVWDLDSAGNACMLAYNKVFKADITGTVVTYDTSAIPLQYYDKLSGISGGNGGKMALSGLNLYLLNDSTWSRFDIFNYRPPLFLTCDRHTGKFYYIAGDSLYGNLAGVTENYYIGNMPYQNVKAISPLQIATPDGLFTYQGNSGSLAPTGFYDTSVHKYIEDITCFEVDGYSNNYYSNYYALYGTHHGVYALGATSVNNALLPDSNINFIYSLDGSDYIGTDKGLCVYNQVFYNTIDTSNSPLPSNKITFITSASVYQQATGTVVVLYVGTDKGFGIYSNGQWQIFDSSSIGTSSFYVTSILPPDINSSGINNNIWVTTKGNGLVMLKTNGTYQFYNKSNQRLMDDTLYYAINMGICEAGEYRYVGTNDSGVCYFDRSYYPGAYDSFDVRYITQPYYGSNATCRLHNSKLCSNYNSQYYNIVLVADSGFFISQECVGIAEHKADKISLQWYIEQEKLYAIMPDNFTGRVTHSIYDMTGRKLSLTDPEINNGARTGIDIAALSVGVYILQTEFGGKTAQTKFIISR
ncbi:MAG: hypothetical protein JWO03_2513 [Bacteroidetes bacterium]|nr:hypothetical protein [Bacteroidota bacterium]